ncbi:MULTISPECIES: DUF262 domain-containing protein [unclassified Campylobacter]|uniref:DUF262 domain-containing protein n=1 Tax=unclassified Campylobacter TaxID=2593542 RepID=UPI001474257E|nr:MULTISPECIES: DUF262 domain-containing protein [unclassified Campylobacter]
MYDNNKFIKEFTIKDLSGEKFKIPLYQREYAWQSDEVLTLIADLEHAEKARYYIGNIVVDKDDNVIDGQQRLTTLYLILMVCDKSLLFELDYEIRDEDSAFLRTKDCSNLDLCKNENMRENLRVILQNKDRLTKELLDKISFTITTLPADTDITRYFELINSRSVQLEKHQILKAKFLSCLEDEEEKFGTIWEFCANMDYYLEDMIYYKNNDKEKTIEKIRNSFLKFVKDPTLNNMPSLFNLIKYDNMPDSVNEYKSIISFDYLLINALKCFRGVIDKKFAMSNLNLLDAFGKNFKYEKAEAEKVKNFILHLLKFKIIFDYFVFKRDEQDKPYFRDIQDADSFFKIDKPKELQMIELLFNFTAENHKAQEWIRCVFSVIDRKRDISYLIEILEKIDNYKTKKKIKKGLNLDQGTNTPHYWFYRLEYLLWKKMYHKEDKKPWKDLYADEQIKKIEAKYYLTRLNSVEHIQPQIKKDDWDKGYSENNNNIGQKKSNQDKVDEFGNLALLTQSRNSSLNASDPIVKKAMVKDWINKNKNIQSLKMLLALEGLKENEQWTYKKCKKHGEEMKRLLELE